MSLQHIKIIWWKPYIAYDSELHLKHATNTSINGFQKFNFIYGENWVGKSTLSIILKFYGKSNAIGQNFESKDLQKKWEVDFVFKHPHSTTASLEWNILVFDRDFISDNIFIPWTFWHKAETDQKKERASKIKFWNVASIEETISSLESQQKALDKAWKEKRFNELQKEIEPYIWIVEVDENGIKQYDEKKLALDKIKTLNNSFAILLPKLKAFFEKDIKNIISKSLLQWIKSTDKLMIAVNNGKNFIIDNTSKNCPLCNQLLPWDVEDYWQKVLHDSLAPLQKEIDSLAKEVESLPIHDLVDKSIVISFIGDHSKWIDIDASYLDKLNRSISIAISEYTKYFETNWNIKKGIEYAKIKSQLQKATEEKDQANNEYKRIADLITEEKTQKMAEYDRYKEWLESFLNDFLVWHWINYFKISMTTPSWTWRWHAQSLIDFEIKPIKSGDQSFNIKNMSEWEQRILWLWFFFFLISQQILLTPDFLKNKIIILDDPMTSFDKDKRKHLSDWIKENFVWNGSFASTDQLFVFTHDDLFYKYLCRDGWMTAGRFRINKWSWISCLMLYEISAKINEYKTEIEKYINSVDRGETITDSQKAHIWQICRNTVDYLVRKKIIYIDQENTTALINDLLSPALITKIQSSQLLLKDLKRMYQYNSYNWTTHIQDESATQNEIYDYCKKLLELILVA